MYTHTLFFHLETIGFNLDNRELGFWRYIIRFVFVKGQYCQMDRGGRHMGGSSSGGGGGSGRRLETKLAMRPVHWKWDF